MTGSEQKYIKVTYLVPEDNLLDFARAASVVDGVKFVLSDLEEEDDIDEYLDEMETRKLISNVKNRRNKNSKN